jgi:hypothetical protein
MIHFIFNIAKEVFFIYLIHEFIKSKFRPQYDYLVILGGDFALYSISKLQIITAKLKTCNMYKKYVDPVFKKKLTAYIEYIDNSYVIHKEILPKQKNPISSLDNYDFCILTSQFSPINKYMHTDDSSLMHLNKTITDVTSTETSFKFVLVEIKIKDLVINIDLKTNEYNFYMIDNKLDKCFWQYIMTNFYYDQLKPIYSASDYPFPEFLIHILDESVSELNIKSADNKYIHLMKDSYKVDEVEQNDTLIIKDSEYEEVTEELEKEEQEEEIEEEKVFDNLSE